MSYGIIYKATGPTGKVYIGQTTDRFSSRKGKHAYRVKKMDRRGSFQVALLEHGFSTFSWEQIDTAESKEELDTKEKQWIAHYKADDPAYGYNATDGGTNTKLSPETKRKIGEANTGNVMSLEARQKMSMAKTGTHHTPETRHKISEANRGEKNSETKISERIARMIKIDLKNGVRIFEIAKKHNVPKSIVKSIKYGTSWAWLEIA